ncbi:hypothetical protein [Leisingera sp. ANG-S3]|uniref:hypothetical protein n=1 Tax=Leisingera sp. ANG-S3 TaxID=1577899 RepID=UPI00057FFA6D|nr:hypothetical protein [Leisingera sp. ANG-S3]KIC23387.1 hypothetical protein RA23_15075 [Leisingera sp. ANG-S3]
MTERPEIHPELLEIRPYTMRNNHVIVEVSYAGVAMWDMFVPERSTLAVFDELARATVRLAWKQLSAHQKMDILEREQLALRELKDVTYVSVSDGSGRMDDDLFDMLSEGETASTPQQS